MPPVRAETGKVVEENDDGDSLVFDAGQTLQSESSIPSKFIWPEYERQRPEETSHEFVLPVIDLQGFFSGDEAAISTTSQLINEACKKHGFFLVVNHGVDLGLIADAHKHMESFFLLPLCEKQRAPRKPGENYGFASSFPGRFSSRLPWKETLSFPCPDHISSPNSVQQYILDVLDENFRKFGKAFQEYCEAMNNLSLGIMELLGLSLGVGRQYFKDFYQENDSVMRLNYYPPCPEPDLTLGTGPHCDTSSLTILHQDEIGGLHVFVDGKWHFVRPIPDAFVINIGDTFMAQTNDIYKSCLHRAVANSRIARKSIGFFLSPKADKIVRPPTSLITTENPRLYPDFTWQTLLEFIQKNYRPSMESTLHAFFKWLQQQNIAENGL